MPPALDHVVRKCLEKDPDDRWQSARDVASQLRWIAEAGSQAGVPTTLAVRRRSRERIAWTLAAGLAVASVGGLAWGVRLRGELQESRRLLRADLVPPPESPHATVSRGAIALSPDGRFLAFPTRGEEVGDLAVRDLASGETKILAGTGGAAFPFWSPDSRWIAFFSEGRLRRVEPSGGPVQAICEASAGRGGSWGRDGTIVFAPDITGPLMKVPSGGGTPAPVTTTPSDDVTHRNPWFLPDGRHFLFTTRQSSAAPFAAVALGSLDGAAPKVLLEQGSNPQYADGYLFTVVDGNLVARAFDPGTLSLPGEPVAIAAGVEFYSPRDIGQYSVSGSGSLVHRARRVRPTRFAWVDRSGRELGVAGEPGVHGAWQVGRDGRTVATVLADASGGNADVWILDLQRSQATRATFVSAPTGLGLALSASGTELAVSASSAGGWKGSTLWIQPASGSGAARSLLERISFTVSGWSSDGRYLVGETQEAGTGFDVAYVPVSEPEGVVRVVSSRFNERGAALSPDGRWLAYHSNETGRDEVFVTDFPAAARKWQVSRSGGGQPSWRDDGKELYFSNEESASSVAVSVRDGGLDLGEPEALPLPRDRYSLASPVVGGLVGGAVRSPDGRRFLALGYVGEDVVEPVRYVRGWRSLVEK
jgi:Tol biopolymer transport system component